jgi:hypothetical protein
MSVLAYVDPGLGLLAWQAVVAAFLGFLFYVKQTRRWVAGVFRKILRLGRPPDPASAVIPAPKHDRLR